MKYLLTTLLFLETLVSFGQIEFDQDTTRRPSKTTTFKPAYKGNNLFIVPKTGLINQIPSTLRSFTEFTTYTQSSALYDGSIWVRKISNPTVTTATVGYGFMISATVGGFHYTRTFNEIDVRWSGAKGNGLIDDLPFCQLAVDFAKSQVANNNLKTSTVVRFPPGNYHFNAPDGQKKSLNINDASGIVLKGGGKYLNTSINGHSGAAIFDFTGSTACGAEGFTFLSENGFTNPSPIGILFALGQNNLGQQTNGLNNWIEDCVFIMNSNHTANGGFGNIGVVNVRSEEFSMDKCLVRCDLGVLYTNAQSVSTTTGSYTFTSASSSTIITGNGSMGVISMNDVSIQNQDKWQPAMILNGTNTLNYIGHIARLSNAGGGFDAALLFQQHTFNDRVHATVESFSQQLWLDKSAHLINSHFELITANQLDATQPCIFLDTSSSNGSTIEGGEINLSWGNTEEVNNSRKFIVARPQGNTDATQTAFISNVKFVIPQWNNVTTMIESDLLNRAFGEVRFLGNTGSSWEKIGNEIRNISSLKKTIGVINNGSVTGTLTTITIPLAPTSNAGGLFIKLNGYLVTGGQGSGGGLSMPVRINCIQHLTANGNKQNFSYTSEVLGSSVTSSSYSQISDTSIIPSISWTGNVGTLSLTLSNSGTATSETIQFIGNISVSSDQRVYSPIISF